MGVCLVAVPGVWAAGNGQDAAAKAKPRGANIPRLLKYPLDCPDRVSTNMLTPSMPVASLTRAAPINAIARESVPTNVPSISPFDILNPPVDSDMLFTSLPPSRITQMLVSRNPPCLNPSVSLGGLSFSEGLITLDVTKCYTVWGRVRFY